MSKEKSCLSRHELLELSRIAVILKGLDTFNIGGQKATSLSKEGADDFSEALLKIINNHLHE